MVPLMDSMSVLKLGSSNMSTNICQHTISRSSAKNSSFLKLWINSNLISITKSRTSRSTKWNGQSPRSAVKTKNKTNIRKNCGKRSRIGEESTSQRSKSMNFTKTAPWRASVRINY